MANSPTSSVTSLNRSPDWVDLQYLNELMADRATLEGMPKQFMHLKRLLDQEIVIVHQRVFDSGFNVSMQLPTPAGQPSAFRKRIYIPESDGRCNYVGRLLGPRGKTLKTIEQETGCKLMIRGSGSIDSGASMGNGYRHQSNSPPAFISCKSLRGTNFCSNDDDFLHVQIQCEDTANRAEIRIDTASSLILSLLSPPMDDVNDFLKQKQLLELSMLRGTLKVPKRFFVSRANTAGPNQLFHGDQSQLSSMQHSVRMMAQPQSVGGL